MSNTPQRGDMSPSLPTTMELAQLAAILSQRRGKADSTELASDALRLWEACQRRLAIADEAARTGKRFIAEWQSKIEKLPKPTTFPVSLDDSLKLLMPKTRRSSDRIKAFRDFQRDCLRDARWHDKHGFNSFPPDNEPLPPLEAVAESIASYKRDGFDEPSYNVFMGSYYSWLSKRTSEINRRNAEARWKKRKSKKSKKGKKSG